MAEFTGTNKNSSPSGASYRAPEKMTASSSFNSMSEGLKDAYATAQQKARAAITSSEDFVKERPLRTVLGAAAVGFLAGYIARRKH